jgi:DNA topoisomerase-1
MQLVIVESPTKAKTISKFLGKKYTVKSSYGHVRDLPTKEMGIDIKNNFAPQYVILAKALARIAELKKLAAKAEKVILATDEDREGEAISWHLLSALELTEKETARIVFHEITKKAIEKALTNPRSIDLNLVDAQQARRVLDRLVGFELSPFLWKKIRRGLSAGRVQSVALRLIVEREKEIEKFQSEKFFAVTAKLKTGDKQEIFDSNLTEMAGEKIEQALTLKLFASDYKIKKTFIDSQKKADEIIADLNCAQFKVRNITEKETLRYPSPPFTTSTLQQAAINNLGFSAKFTMSVAQKIYEKGYITYMRTDSLNLSLESILSTQKTITQLFGKNYALSDPKFYKTKSQGAQEAHEAIRPAYPDKTPDDLRAELDPSEQKLYSLIWKRMLASQMQPAIFDSVKLEITATGKQNYLLQANGSTIKFDGYLKVYNGKANGENLLPKMKIGENLNLIEVLAVQKETSAPPRYNEATLVKVMEENGIGRPSTYAPTISTILERKYIDKNEEKRLYPLEIGTLVSDLLVAHFPEIVDIKFTATIELDFDKIAEGKRKWVPVIAEFYKPFHKNLQDKTKKVKKEDFQEKLDRNCPLCQGSLIVKFGRFGKFIACSNYPTCRHTEKTEEEKKVDLEHQGIICEICGAPMAVKRGKFGTFLGCSNYPECKNIQKIEKKIGVKCPKCQPTADRPQGDIVEKKSKRGKVFFGCNNYPACDFALWSKPTGEKCSQCGSLLIFAAKGATKCSSKECGKSLEEE